MMDGSRVDDWEVGIAHTSLRNSHISDLIIFQPFHHSLPSLAALGSLPASPPTHLFLPYLSQRHLSYLVIPPIST